MLPKGDLRDQTGHIWTHRHWYSSKYNMLWQNNIGYAASIVWAGFVEIYRIRKILRTYAFISTRCLRSFVSNIVNTIARIMSLCPPVVMYIPLLIKWSVSVWMTSTTKASVGSKWTRGSVSWNAGPAGSKPLSIKHYL